jgi:hypothetical protein
MRRQITRYTALTITLLGTLAVGARAQERDRQPAPDRERTFTLMVGPDGEFQVDLRRGRMGINVDLRADAARDSIGARVAGVTPGGPADRAGVRTGDLITRLNGTRLAVAAPEGDEFQSRPAERLLRTASRLAPGDTVRLDLRRGTQNLQLSFVTEASDMDRVVERLRLPMMREFQRPLLEPGAARMRVFAFGGAGPRDLEMVAVNPGLGDYFGTTEGLLVVDVGADTSLGLRAGDVILQIGGRRPTSPSHAMRILSTYEADETVRFDIMRQKRRATVNGRMPRREGQWRVAPNTFEMRIPPVDLEPLMRMPAELHRILPRMRWQPGTPEIEHEAAPKSLMRTDGWT